MVQDEKYLRGKVYNIAGTGRGGYSGDGMLKALDTSLCIHGLRIDSANNLYFNDFINHRVSVVKF